PDKLASQPSPTAITANDPELDCWMLVKNSDNISDIQYYIKNYPNGKYIIPARLKLQQVSRQQQLPKTDLPRVQKEKLSAEWVNQDGNYWIYVNGKPYSRGTRSEWIDNDLLVYIPDITKYFLMEDYKFRSDNTLRPAKPVYSPNTALWRNENGLFWLYVEGRSNSNIKSEYAGDDVLAYVPALKKYYLLKDYRHRADNTLRPAQYIHTPNQTLWRNKEDLFWLYINGKSGQTGARNAWINNDLLVFVPESKKYYLLENYKNLDDNTFRPAKEISSPNNTLWANEKGKYWLFVNGSAHQKESISIWVGDDLLVYVRSLKQYFLMKGYKNRGDRILTPAQQIVSPNGTLWRRKGKRYWLIVDGKAYHVGSSSEWKGNDLIVHVPELNRSYRFKDYKNRNDNTLRPAVIN
ncbi:MAG: hypothetical protein KAT17_08170, partial [Candidatus Aminicenantes bacterium]|nr:hypothetical protein [Candidatus Aminicenantes bacterium]